MLKAALITSLLSMALRVTLDYVAMPGFRPRSIWLCFAGARTPLLCSGVVALMASLNKINETRYRPS
jgi:hypothetical protein